MLTSTSSTDTILQVRNMERNFEDQLNELVNIVSSLKITEEKEAALLPLVTREGVLGKLHRLKKQLEVYEENAKNDLKQWENLENRMRILEKLAKRLNFSLNLS